MSLWNNLRMIAAIVLYPTSWPYLIAFIAMVIGFILTVRNPERWKYILLIAFEAVTLVVCAIISLSTSSIFGLVCSRLLGLTSAIMLIVTIFVFVKTRKSLIFYENPGYCE